MKDIMLDLETMDNVATASIVSIGAVEFNPITGELGKEFYRVVNLQSCIDIGLTVSAGTLYWWLNQNKPAIEAITDSNKVRIDTAAESFIKFCEDISTNSVNTSGYCPNIRLWGNGATFDNAIFRYVFHKLNKPFPIPFWNDRDVRTILGFYPNNLWEDYKFKNLRKGYHNSLADSKYQAKYVSHIMKELGVEDLY